LEKPNELSLSNICGGAAEEVFSRELLEVLTNIADVNTPAEAKRKITLTFDFTPFQDRSGAQVDMSSSSKLAAIQKVRSNVFIFRKGDLIKALPHDPRQAALFEEKQPEGVAEMPKKQAK